MGNKIDEILHELYNKGFNHGDVGFKTPCSILEAKQAILAAILEDGDAPAGVFVNEKLDKYQQGYNNCMKEWHEYLNDMCRG